MEWKERNRNNRQTGKKKREKGRRKQRKGRRKKVSPHADEQITRDVKQIVYSVCDC